jgi:hypothetical protein
VLWAAGAEPSDSFLQFGAVGAIALIALAAVRYLYRAQIDALRAQLAREIARADRLETELATVNAGALRQAREAVESATHAVADASRRLGGEPT